MQLYEIGAGITGLLLFGAMALTQMSKDWQTPGGWLLVSLVGIPLFVLAIGFAIKNPVLLFGDPGRVYVEGGSIRREALHTPTTAPS